MAKNQYVSVQGYAWYETAYTEDEDGKTIATYFFLFDETTGHVVVVKADTKTLDGRTEKPLGGAIPLQGSKRQIADFGGQL